MACLRALTVRPRTAAAVRCFRLNLLRDYRAGPLDPGVAEAVFNTFGEALDKLSGLEKLLIMNWDDMQLPARLPRGRSLRNLQHYYGPPEVVDNNQSSSLLVLHIRSYKPRSQAVALAMAAAANLNGFRLETLDLGHAQFDYDFEGWLNLIPEVPRLFPNIKFLGLGNWLRVDADLLDGVTPWLAKLANLLFVEIGISWRVPPNEQWTTIQRLHTACPQLRAISLGSWGPEWRFSEERLEWLRPWSSYSEDYLRAWEKADCRKSLGGGRNDGLRYQVHGACSNE